MLISCVFFLLGLLHCGIGLHRGAMKFSGWADAEGQRRPGEDGTLFCLSFSPAAALRVCCTN